MWNMKIPRIIILAEDYDEIFNEIDRFRFLTDDWQYDRFDIRNDDFKQYFKTIEWKNSINIHSQMNSKEYEELLSYFYIKGSDFDDRLIIGSYPEISSQLSSGKFFLNLCRIIEQLDSFCHRKGFIFLNEITFYNMIFPKKYTISNSKTIIRNYPGLIYEIIFKGFEKIHQYFFYLLKKIVFKKTSLKISYNNEIIQIKKKQFSLSYLLPNNGTKNFQQEI